MDRPVIVHRAVLGSVERMFAILTEHYAGKWPFWINPRQVGCRERVVATEGAGGSRKPVFLCVVLSCKWPFWINPRQMGCKGRREAEGRMVARRDERQGAVYQVGGL